MNKQEDIAKALKARLSELKRRVAEIDREPHTQLSADSEEQAIDLENQEALEAIENFGVQETSALRPRASWGCLESLVIRAGFSCYNSKICPPSCMMGLLLEVTHDDS